MNTHRSTPLAALALLAALAGCERRDEAAVATPSPGSTASAPGMTGDSGSMSSGSGAGGGTAMPPAGGASGMDSSTAPPQPGASAPPAGSTSMAPAGGGELSRADQTFVVKAASAGLYEVEVSQLAADKASDPKVKGFAAMLVDHHSAANAELKALAQAHGVELPDEVPAAKQAVIDKLAKQSGAGFDREYVRTVGIQDHETDIRMFETASRDAGDAQLKGWIDKTLPTLREHLAAAKKLPGADGAAKS